MINKLKNQPLNLTYDNLVMNYYLVKINLNTSAFILRMLLYLYTEPFIFEDKCNHKWLWPANFFPELVKYMYFNILNPVIPGQQTNISSVCQCKPLYAHVHASVIPCTVSDCSKSVRYYSQYYILCSLNSSHILIHLF